MEHKESQKQIFAEQLHERLAESNLDENLFLSPLSIRIALSMCACGAIGETRYSLTDLINAPDDLESQNQQFAALLREFENSREPSLKLIFANSFWVRDRFPLNASFQETIAEFYDGVCYQFDSSKNPRQICEGINAWVNRKTQSCIQKIVNEDSITSDTEMLLTNAIYFRALWERSFEVINTRNQVWYGPREYEVPMMRQESGFLYYECEDFQAVNLPYKGRQLSMLVVLPRDHQGLHDLEAVWRSESLFQKTTQGFDAETVVVSLPRFQIESAFNLSSVLSSLHCALPFSEGADFSGISDYPLKLSEVVHKTFVKVNEFGTEAAAATVVSMKLSTGTGSIPPPPMIFNADHPFLFFIWSRKTGTIYFSGHVIDP